MLPIEGGDGLVGAAMVSQVAQLEFQLWRLLMASSTVPDGAPSLVFVFLLLLLLLAADGQVDWGKVHVTGVALHFIVMKAASGTCRCPLLTAPVLEQVSDVVVGRLLGCGVLLRGRRERGVPSFPHTVEHCTTTCRHRKVQKHLV